jgi:DNA (cytosine-5)-methyltransferase 1
LVSAVPTSGSGEASWSSKPGRRGVDLICGGFPCQDISVAGKGAGIEGARSGLWSEYARIVGEVQPRYVIVENVAALLHRGLDRVLGDLAALGYDAEWHCIPASAVGAPHRRDRIWIIAHPTSTRLEGAARESVQRRGIRPAIGGNVADANSAGREQQWRTLPIREELASTECAGWWGAQSDVGRVAHGVPNRVDRLRGLGNAVVPQIPEIIGRAIMRQQP